MDQRAPPTNVRRREHLAAAAKTRVVSIPNRPKNAETRRDHILGCRVPTGKRFELFFSRSFGDDLIERDHFEIVGDRWTSGSSRRTGSARGAGARARRR